MKKWYEILFYDGDGKYHLVDRAQSGAGGAELKDKITNAARRVRRVFGVDRDVPNRKIYESLYVMQVDELILARDILNP